MRACVIIPARYSSSRFPGKPLCPLLGKPMILWVAEVAAKAVGQSNVFVATDDDGIAEVTESAGFTAMLTNPNALTGTDRIAEVADKINYDTYVNVQGDEPLINHNDIKKCISLKAQNPNLVVNGFCWIGKNEDPSSLNIPKVITTEEGIMVYMSRNLLPGFKEIKNAHLNYKKQVCIYGFNKDDLSAYLAFGRKSELERCEDIEVLRFIELDKKVMMYECSPGSLAVDVPSDVEKVEAAMAKQGLK